jgi:outer membrane protein
MRFLQGEGRALSRSARIGGGVLLCAIALAAAPVFAQNKIGFVSLDRILRDAAPAQRAQKSIEAEFSKRDQELTKMGDQLKRMQEGLEKNAVTMADAERARREREFNDTNREFQRRKREFGEDLNARRNEELSAIIARANQVIRRLAEAEKFDAIFQNDQVVWASPKIDITDKVIKALEDSKPADSKAAK